jgi:crotonobetainyl-CoA:carnitine CoA-transferase CaiB-like acyl-CoA transferase
VHLTMMATLVAFNIVDHVWANVGTCGNDEWATRLDAMDVPNSRINTLSDVAIAFPVDFLASPDRMTRPPPLLGEHNREVFGAPPRDSHEPPELRAESQI